MTAGRPCNPVLVTLMACLLTHSVVKAAVPRRGLALGMFSTDPDERYHPYLDEVVAQGATDLSLVVVWYQRDVRATEILRRDGFSPSEANLNRTIEAAHRRGLRLMLFPIVGIEERKADEWRGRIEPSDWSVWFEGYTRFIAHMAEVAARHEVEILSVGSELVSTEAMRERWQALIARVRTIYKGQLLYSANWDHYEPVSFWDQVDMMGVTGYYELTRTRTPSLEAIKQAWGRWRRPLIAFSDRIARPLVFTEIGYPAIDGANIYPWDETRREARDEVEQALCYRAFIEVWDRCPVLAGVYFWNWFGAGGPLDTNYTPRGKPAAEEIRSWYRGTM